MASIFPEASGVTNAVCCHDHGDRKVSMELVTVFLSEASGTEDRERAEAAEKRLGGAARELEKRIKAAEDQAEAEPDDYPGEVFKGYARAEAEALKFALRLLQPISAKDLERASEYVRERGLQVTQPAPTQPQSLSREDGERLEEIVASLEHHCGADPNGPHGIDKDVRFLRDLKERLGDGGRGEAGLRGALEQIATGRGVGASAAEGLAACRRITTAALDGPAAQAIRLTPDDVAEHLRGEQAVRVVVSAIDALYERVREPDDAEAAKAGNAALAKMFSDPVQPVPSCLSEEGVREKLLGELERLERDAEEDREFNADKANGKKAAALAMRRALDEL